LDWAEAREAVSISIIGISRKKVKRNIDATNQWLRLQTAN
jgi:hypothetical protein